MLFNIIHQFRVVRVVYKIYNSFPLVPTSATNQSTRKIKGWVVWKESHQRHKDRNGSYLTSVNSFFEVEIGFPSFKSQSLALCVGTWYFNHGTHSRLFQTSVICINDGIKTTQLVRLKVKCASSMNIGTKPRIKQ